MSRPITNTLDPFLSQDSCTSSLDQHPHHSSSTIMKAPTSTMSLFLVHVALFTGLSAAACLQSCIADHEACCRGLLNSNEPACAGILTCRMGPLLIDDGKSDRQHWLDYCANPDVQDAIHICAPVRGCDFPAASTASFPGVSARGCVSLSIADFHLQHCPTRIGSPCPW